MSAGSCHGHSSTLCGICAASLSLPAGITVCCCLLIRRNGVAIFHILDFFFNKFSDNSLAQATSTTTKKIQTLRYRRSAEEIIIWLLCPGYFAVLYSTTVLLDSSGTYVTFFPTRVTCDDEEERASRKVLRGCSRAPSCTGCMKCVCFGCETCRFKDCDCQTCVDFYRNSKD